MITKETVKSEIERVPPDRLAELYEVVKSFTESKPRSSQPSLMSKLKRIRISAPPDFSENIDLYLSGEKTFE
jgi:hypothetical protein